MWDVIRQVRADQEEGLTHGRKRPDNFNYFGVPVNVIPGGHPGPCCEHLFTYIYDEDSLERRLLESLNLVLDPDRCLGICRFITITTQWVPRVIEKNAGLISSARRARVEIVFCLIINNDEPNIFRLD